MVRAPRAATRDLFHWVSALIALPALVFAGRVFFRSAWSALRHGRMNMDVPIALGVSLAYGMSLYETIDAWRIMPISTPPSRCCSSCSSGARSTMSCATARAPRCSAWRSWRRAARWCCAPMAAREYRPVSEIEPGMQLLIAAGERIPVDARVERGRIGSRLLAGYRRERSARGRARRRCVRAGTLNLTGALTIEATARAARFLPRRDDAA